jgi:Zn-dependent peptidase ImmA (M78 family)
MSLKLEYIDYGLGYYDTKKNEIYINEQLFSYPILFKEILKHELDHSICKNEIEHTLLDIVDSLNIPKQIRIALFSFNKPNVLKFNLPIYYHNGWCFSILNLTLIAITLVIISVLLLL